MKDQDTLYARWLNNELSPDELETMKAEGADKDLERIMKVTASWKLPAYDKVSGLKAVKAKRIQKEAPVRRLNVPWIVGIAASFLMAFVLYSLLFGDQSETIMAQNGSVESVGLADGSQIIVNAGSNISYNKEDWSKDRNIELEGEAFFEVTKGSPFVVNTPNGTVKVLGTKFNVRAWGNNLHVECYEGSVQVDAGENQSVLVLNEAVNVVNGSMNNKEGIDHQSPKWQSGTSQFNQEPAEEVLKELERQFDVTIESPELTQSFTGAFRHDDLKASLESVCIPLGLTYSVSEDGKEVLIQK